MDKGKYSTLKDKSQVSSRSFFVLLAINRDVFSWLSRVSSNFCNSHTFVSKGYFRDLLLHVLSDGGLKRDKMDGEEAEISWFLVTSLSKDPQTLDSIIPMIQNNSNFLLKSVPPVCNRGFLLKVWIYHLKLRYPWFMIRVIWYFQAWQSSIEDIKNLLSVLFMMS